MTLAGASLEFLDYVRRNELSAGPPDSSIHESRAWHDKLEKKRASGPLDSSIHERAVRVLWAYAEDVELRVLTARGLFDFLTRWYPEVILIEGLTRLYDAPAPVDLVDSIAEFANWAWRRGFADLPAGFATVLEELRHTVPQALIIDDKLLHWCGERRGAFTFPEFLTSFEEGGRSEYDIDSPGGVGAIQGYFRIIRVQDSHVEAEELIREERVWPIIFPPEVAALLDDEYIIDGQLVRTEEGWKFFDCGVVYPPGTRGVWEPH